MDINKATKRKNEEWMLKTRIDVKHKLDEIRVERVKRGLDLKMKSYSELVEAGLRFNPLIDILKKADIKEKNGTQKN